MIIRELRDHATDPRVHRNPRPARRHLVANDTGGAVTQLLLADGCDRVGRVVLTPCDSFDNFVPRSIRALQYLARIPGALAIGAQPARIRSLQRLGFRTLAY
jgi:hypothetical protein